MKTFPIPFNKIDAKNTIFKKAIASHSKGDLFNASYYYQLFLKKGFLDPKILSNYGVICQEKGEINEAIKLYQKSIKNFPTSIEAYINLGRLLREIGRLNESKDITHKVIEIDPNYSIAFDNLGIIYKELGDFKKSELFSRKAIRINPKFTLAYFNLGNTLKELGRYKEAEMCYLSATRLDPSFAEAFNNLGSNFYLMNKYNEAEKVIKRALKINPNLIEAYSNLGRIARENCKYEQAANYLKQAIRIKPNSADSHSNLGNIYKDLGKLIDAEKSILMAIKLKPNFNDAFFNLSLIQLLKGDYKNGLKNYEYRFKKNKPIIPHGNIKIKKLKENILSKNENLLILSEQGLGDTIQYMRYVLYLKKQGLNIIFCAQTKLHTLIKASKIDSNPIKPEEAIHINTGSWISLLSIPRLLGVNPNNPIIKKPYIQVKDDLFTKWKNKLANETSPIVGINWQGNKDFERKSYQGRSIPLESFSELLKENKITFLSLQKGYGSEQKINCSFKDNFVKIQNEIDSILDFHENAAIISNCSLIITCDTAVAHLAGGMGKNVWLLLKKVPYWTWGMESDSTFWYPNMKLFRQSESFNWHELMERLSITLKKEMESKLD